MLITFGNLNFGNPVRDRWRAGFNAGIYAFWHLMHAFKWKSEILTFVLSCSFICINVSGQVTVSSEVLIGKKWLRVSPSCSESELSFDANLVTQRVSWPSIGKTHEFSSGYYLDDTCPELFDSTKVGKPSKGCYLVRQAKYKFVCMKILSATDTELKMIRVIKPQEIVIGEPEPILYVREW